MRLCSLLILALLFPALVKSQSVDEYNQIRASMEKFVEKLAIGGIDSIFTRQMSTAFDKVVNVPVGASVAIEDSLICESKDSGFVVWISHGKTFAKRFHPCFDYKTVQVPSSMIIDFLKTHRDLVTSPTIKPFQYKDKRGKAFTLTVDHQEAAELYVKLGDKDQTCVIDSFDISRTDYDGSRENINYETNKMNTILLFSKMLEGWITGIQFERQ